MAYALLVESYAGTGMSLYPEAVGRADEIIYGPLSEEEMTVEEAKAAVPTPADNDAALAALTGMMAGVTRR